MIVCNTRILSSPLAGQNRYTRELLTCMGNAVECVAPLRPLSGVRGHLWEQVQLPALLKGRLLWSPSTTGPLAVARQVVTVHDVITLEQPEWVGSNFAKWYRFLLPRLLPKVSHIIAVSQDTKQRLLANIPLQEDRISVVYNGVDSRFKPREEPDIIATIKALSLPSRHYLLSVCSLEPRKNIVGLLKAWTIAHNMIPDDIWLVLCGQQGLKHVFGQYDLGSIPPRVHMTGHVPDEHLPNLISGALAFIYLSFYEGFGLPPLEAMACGTPCITSNCAAIPEIVGDAAIKVPPADIEAIADAIRILVEDAALRREISIKGLDRARQFDWTQAAHQTLAVLRAAEEEAA